MLQSLQTCVTYRRKVIQNVIEIDIRNLNPVNDNKGFYFEWVYCRLPVAMETRTECESFSRFLRTETYIEAGG